MLDPQDPWRRTAARQLTRAFVDRSPSLVDLGGVDLTDTLEQAFFGALRRMPPAQRAIGGDRLRGLVRVGVSAARGLGAARAPRGRVIVLVRRSIRATVFRPIGEELQRRGLPAPLLVSLDPGLTRRDEAALDLTRQLGPGDVPPLLRLVMAAARVPLPVDEWRAIAPQVPTLVLRAVIRQVLPRLAVDAARVDAITRRLAPTALVAFQEVGPWARIIPAVGRARGVPTIDLPHAEANDPIGSFELTYDAIAVYGPRSAQILGDAGTERNRIHEVGPLRYDALIRATGGSSATISEGRRVIYASQPVKPRPGLTTADKLTTYRSALAAAGVAAPSELVVQPHPNEPLDELRRLVASEAPPTGVTVRLPQHADLHELLPGAWLLVTASSQSVYEAAIAGVPSISLFADATGGVTHVAEGFSQAADGPASAADLARGLLDDDARRSTVDRARAALRARFGELDGRAAERAATLIHELASRA
jgi:hypothetical protein